MNAWLLAGWTMLHFLWVGALAAAIGAIVRLAVRRCGPNVRYAASLAMLAAVACVPAVIACVLASNPAWMASAWEPPALPVDGVPQEATSMSMPTVQGVPRQSRGLSGGPAPETFVELKGWDAAPQPPALPGGSGDAVRGAVVGGDAIGAATPGQSPGLKDAGAVRLASVAAANAETPSLRWGLGSGLMRRVVGALPVMWLIGAPVTFLLLAAGLVGSRRLTRSGMPVVDGPVAEACARLRSALGVSRRVALAAVEGLAQPVLVGIVKPTILLPAAALNGWTVEELEMVLVHELAHVRRWDNLVNLGQRVIEAALFFHPCVWLASRQVRRDREECCDAIVVQHTQAPEAYAELLVSVASQLRSEPGRPRLRAAVMALATASPMAQHALVGRVRRILKLEDDPMWISRRMIGLLVVLAICMLAFLRGALAVPEPIKVVTGDAVDATEADTPHVRVYPIGDVEAIDPVAWLRLTAGKKDVEIAWDDRTRAMLVTAPTTVHKKISELLSRTRDAGDLERSQARFAKLRQDAAMYQNRLLQVERDLVDAEVMKQVAIQSSGPPLGLDAAVAAEVDKDPQVSMFKKMISDLGNQITALKVTSGNVSPQLKTLQEQYQRTVESNFAYRAQAEAEARERLQKIPDGALRAAMTEYNVRYDYLTKKKAELEKLLTDAEAQLNATPGEAEERVGNGISPPEASSVPAMGEGAAGRESADRSTLQEILECRARLRMIDRELADAEAMKQEATHQPQSPAALDEAVTAELDRDSQMEIYKAQISALNDQIQNLNDPAVSAAGADHGAATRALLREIGRVQRACDDYRKTAAATIRERLSKGPNEAQRTAILEHNIRVEQLKAKKAGLEGSLRSFEVLLKQLTTGEAEERVAGTVEHTFPFNPELFECAKILGEAPELSLHWNRSDDSLVILAPKKVLDALMLCTDAAKLQKTSSDDSMKEFSELFAADPDNAPVTVEYSFTAFDELAGSKGAGIDLFEGYVRDPYGPKLPISWRELSDDQVKVTMARAGHAWLRLMTTPTSPLVQAMLDKGRTDAEAERAEDEQREPLSVDESGSNVVESELLVNADGSALLDAEAVTKEELGPRLGSRGYMPRIRLRAVAGLPYKQVVAWMDALREAGVRDIGVDSRTGTAEAENQPDGSGDPYATTDITSFPVTEDGAIRFPADADPALVKQTIANLTKAGWKVENTNGTWFIRRKDDAKESRRPVVEPIPADVSLDEAHRIVSSLREQGYEASVVPGEDFAELALEVRNLEIGKSIGWRKESVDGGEKSVLALGGPAPVEDATIATTQVQSPPATARVEPERRTPYRIGPGDTLLVRTYGELPDRPGGEFTVEDEGTIALGPFYGRVEVAGLTVREAEAAVLKSLTESLKDVVREPPKVQVTLGEKAAKENEHPPALDPRYYSAAPGAMPVPTTAPDGTVVGPLVAVADHFPKGVTEEAAEKIVAELRQQGIQAEVRKAGEGELLLLIRTTSPRARIVWKKHIDGSGERWSCVVEMSAGVPDRDVSAWTPPAVAPPGVSYSPWAPVVPLTAPTPDEGAPTRGFRAEYAIVPMLPELDADETKRIADELVEQGFDATPVRVGTEMKLHVLVQGLSVQPKPVWETKTRDDAQGKTSIMKTLRLVGPDGQVIAPNAEAALRRAPAIPEPDLSTADAGSLENYAPARTGPTPLYDGKTFEQWRGEWRTELKVEKRMESIEAMAAFARAGYGREAAEDLLDVAGEYDFSMLDDEPEGKLKQRVVELLAGYPKPIPSSVWLPVLVERFKADPAKWRSLMRAVLGRVYDADAAMQSTIRELKDNPEYDIAMAGWRALLGSADNSGDQDERSRLLREGLGSESAEIRKFALSWTGFKELEKFPEPFEMLFAEDADVALDARQQLGLTPEKFRGALAERLWTVANDPERARSRVAALRAIGVLYGTSVASYAQDSQSDRVWRSDTAKRLLDHLNTGPHEELAAAAWSLDDNWDDGTKLKAWIASRRISKERLEEVLANKEKIAEEREAAMGPPPQHPGSGGGFF